MLWVKLAFVAALAVAGLMAALRLSTPGRPLGRGARSDVERVCALRIAGLALPVFVAVLWAMRGLAPTRLRLAGAAAGLLSGAAGAMVYAFHCPELAAPFLGVWYVAGVSIPAALGALIGPRVLRW